MRKRSSGPPSKKVSRAKRPGTPSVSVVGIGASAGGLEAFTQLLKHLPGDTGMAFVVVQHLDPTHPSMLTGLLAKATPMRVREAKDDMLVEANHVYVIPPNTSMSITREVLHLIPRAELQGKHMPIDYFLRSLAEDKQSGAIGVILSGSASDGTLGLGAIKAEGGIAFVQDENTAKYDGMPRSAIAAGVADFVLPPEGIARELARIASHPWATARQPQGVEELPPGKRDPIDKIVGLLRSATGVDFAAYRQSTIRRRVGRRAVLQKLRTLDEYCRYLQRNPAEVSALYQDILINVSGFFRDPHTYDVLKARVLPAIMKNRSADSPIRVWVPGCSTGEEPYSLAICLLEYLASVRSNPTIHVFATDISDRALERARAGVYSESFLGGVSPERRERFFVRANGDYRVSKSVRDLCIFARHDVTKDPPFSRLDLVSCRNVLIYLGPILQERVRSILYYALKPSGFLVLGASETLGGSSSGSPEAFSVVDKKGKIYRKHASSGKVIDLFGTRDRNSGQGVVAGRISEADRRGIDVEKEADRVLLSRYAPAGVVVNGAMEILAFRGRTGPYLEPAPGATTLNIAKMAHKDLTLELRRLIQRAKKEEVPTRKEHLRIADHRRYRNVNVEVIPFKPPASQDPYFLVVFEEVPVRAATKPGEPLSRVRRGRGQSEERERSELRRELADTKEYLESVLESHATSKEEAQAANEELLSANEELQSTNEELQTAKEELQSTNEELSTLNEELQNRNVELSELNNDLTNLLASLGMPIVMLGDRLNIRRYTPAAGRVLNLIPTDVGRPITHIKSRLQVPDLGEMLARVFDTAEAAEIEVPDAEGHWYSLRIHPYQPVGGRVEGAVMSVVDVDVLVRSIEEVRKARDYAEAVVDTVREPLLVLGGDLRVRSANAAFYRTFAVSRADTEGRSLFELGDGQWNIPELLEMLKEVLPENRRIEDFEVEREFPGIGSKAMLLNARQVLGESEGRSLILLAIEDVTARRQAEKRLRQTLDDLREAQAQLVRGETLRAVGELAAGMAHHLNNLLAVILGRVQLLLDTGGAPEVQRALGVVERAALDGADVVRRVQGFTRVRRVAGAGPIDLNQLAEEVLELTRPRWEREAQVRGIQIDASLARGDIPAATGDPSSLREVLMNLILNAIDALPAGGSITLTTWASGERVHCSVADSGVGMPEEVRERAVEPFFTTRGSKSTGLGLSLAYGIVQRCGGSLDIESAVGQGTRVTIHLPVAHAAPVSRPDRVTPQSTTLTILLIDDEPEVLGVLAEMLTREGHCVIRATGGREGLARLEAGELVDLVLTDLVMPEMTGSQVARAVKARWPHLAVGLITGWSERLDSTSEERENVSFVIAKPVELGAMREAIARVRPHPPAT